MAAGDLVREGVWVDDRVGDAVEVVVVVPEAVAVVDGDAVLETVFDGVGSGETELVGLSTRGTRVAKDVCVPVAITVAGAEPEADDVIDAASDAVAVSDPVPEAEGVTLELALADATTVWTGVPYSAKSSMRRVPPVPYALAATYAAVPGAYTCRAWSIERTKSIDTLSDGIKEERERNERAFGHSQQGLGSRK